MVQAARCLISGRVQGVFYRASTQAQALDLGITGWARNLQDGRVEVIACGDAASIARLKSWLWQGPSAADVSDVRCEWIEIEKAPEGFNTA